MILDYNKIKIEFKSEHILISVTDEYFKETYEASMKKEKMFISGLNGQVVLGLIINRFTHVDRAMYHQVFLSNNDEWDNICDREEYRNEMLKAIGI